MLLRVFILGMLVAGAFGYLAITLAYWLKETL
jgi:hypothetical protein